MTFRSGEIQEPLVPVSRSSGNSQMGRYGADAQVYHKILYDHSISKSLCRRYTCGGGGRLPKAGML